MMRLLLIALALLTTGRVLRAETNEIRITDGKLTASQPPQQQDRMVGSKAAAKAAAAGAAMGKVTCMMMMNEARKEEDKSTRMAMMMMAMQQCNQASELEKSAAENDKGRKALSMADIPKQATYTAGKSELIPGNVKETKLSYDEDAPERQSIDMGSVEVADTFQPVIAPPFSPSKGSDVADGGPQVQGAPIPPGSPLNPIEKPKLEFDDTAKAPALTATAGLMPMGFGTSGSGQNGAGATAANATQADDSVGKGLARARGIASDAGPGTGSGSSEGSERSGKGEEAFDALMSQLMGEAPPEEALVGAGQIIVGREGEEDAGDRANIFEYASVRFQRLKTDDKRLGPAPIPAKPPGRTLATVKS